MHEHIPHDDQVAIARQIKPLAMVFRPCTLSEKISCFFSILLWFSLNVNCKRACIHMAAYPLYVFCLSQASEFVWDANNRNIAPNGAVMRTSILGVHQYQDIEQVKKNTLDVCKITHADPRSVLVFKMGHVIITCMFQEPQFIYFYMRYIRHTWTCWMWFMITVRLIIYLLFNIYTSYIDIFLHF